MIRRGGIHWVDFGDGRGSGPARRRPVVVVSADDYNLSRLSTVIVAVVTSNTALAALPGNVLLPADLVGLPRDSVVNVTALATLDRSEISDEVAYVPTYLMADVDDGLRRSLGLSSGGVPDR